MPLTSIKSPGNHISIVSRFLRLFILSLLPAAFTLSSVQAQTVAYVTNDTSIQTASASGNTVSVIDVASNTVTATITVGNGPTGVVFSPDGTLAYVTNLNDGTISVINTGANSVTATINLGTGVQPALLAITPDGKNLYVPDQNNGNVLVVSTATNTVTATISAVPGAFSVSITPNGSQAYVLSQTGSGIAVIATGSNTVTTTFGALSVSLSGFNMAAAPDGSEIFVSGGLFQTVPVIGTASNSVATTISLPNANFAFFLGITPDGGVLYASNGNENSANPNSVLVIDPSTGTVSATSIPVGVAPAGLAVTPDGEFVYVANNGSNSVSVIATATNTVVATIPVGVTPLSIAIANLSANFAAFTVEDLDISEHQVRLDGDLTLGATSGGLDFAHQAVVLTVGNFNLTIPAGKVKQVGGQHHFVFHGTVNGLKVDFDLKSERGSSAAFDYSIQVKGVDVDTPNPVMVQIGHNTGTASANQNYD
jgi:YVTN family beta-propeller protein